MHSEKQSHPSWTCAVRRNSTIDVWTFGRSDVLALVLSAFFMTMLLAGCSMQRTVLDQSVVDAYPDPMDELDFLDDLETKHVVTNNDALHALLLVVDPVDVPEGFDGRVARARQHGWISERDELHPNESARLGTIAVAVCDILEIKGGLTMRVLGPSRRYATRELVYLEMVPRRTENQSLNGLEFIELLSRVEEWQARREPVRDPELLTPRLMPQIEPEPELDESPENTDHETGSEAAAI